MSSTEYSGTGQKYYYRGKQKHQETQRYALHQNRKRGDQLTEHRRQHTVAPSDTRHYIVL